MAAYVPPEHTVCLKSVPKTLLARVHDVIARETSLKSIVNSPDKDPKCAGQFLVFANYASGRDAVRARDALHAWVVDNWPAAHHAARPVVVRKSDMNSHVYFALFVANAPMGTTVGEIERLFEKFGPLHLNPRVRAIKDDGTFFVNFASFEGAEAAIEEASKRRLHFRGALLVAKAARSTLFINDLITKMHQTGKYSISLDDAKRVGAQMKDWAPIPSSIESLLKAIPNKFVVDAKQKQVHLIDGRAPQAPRLSPGPPQSPPRPPSPSMTEEEEQQMKARKDAANHLLHDNSNLLVSLFRSTWFRVKGEPWLDSEDGSPSASAEQLQKELYMDSLLPVMRRPVEDWDVSTLATALNAASLKSCLSTQPCAERRVLNGNGSSESIYVRYVVLVEEGHLQEDLLDKYSVTFSAAHCNGAQAVQTIRFVRNILSHLSAKGLSAASFDCLWHLTSQAFTTLAKILGTEFTVRFENPTRQPAPYSAAPTMLRVGSTCCSSSSKSAEDDDGASVCSTTSTAPSNAAATSAVDAWLASIHLEKYSADMKEYGYDSLKALDSASEEDIKEMMEEIGMKKPHRVVLMNEWKKLMSPGSAYYYC